MCLKLFKGSLSYVNVSKCILQTQTVRRASERTETQARMDGRVDVNTWTLHYIIWKPVLQKALDKQAAKEGLRQGGVMFQPVSRAFWRIGYWKLCSNNPCRCRETWVPGRMDCWMRGHAGM